jgi:hypothetical protein
MTIKRCNRLIYFYLEGRRCLYNNKNEKQSRTWEGWASYQLMFAVRHRHLCFVF